MSSNNVRVLEIQCEPISSGGQEAFIMNVIDNIDNERVTIDLFTPYYCDNENYANVVKENGGKLYVHGLDFKAGGLKTNIVSPIRKVLRENKYDVVHIHSGSVFSLAMASYAAKLERVPKIIVHSHATADKHTLKRDLIKTVCTPIINSCATDFLACSHEAGKWKFSQRVCDNKLRIIKNGIKLEKYAFDIGTRNRIRQSLHIDDDTVVIGHVGRFSHEKNQAFIVELQKELLSRGFNSLVLFIGAGDDETHIKDIVQSYGIDGSVVFQGRVNNVNDYLQAMDMFLLPSLYEGLGIVAIEAQAAGLPVITSDNVPQAVVLSDRVVQIPLSDRTAWIDTIMRTDTQTSARDTKIAALDEYDVKTTVQDVEHIYCGNGKRNVLIFGMTPNPGGVESFIMNYYRKIDRERFCFDFLCNTHEEIAYTEEIMALGGSIYHITPKGENPIRYHQELREFFRNHSSEYDVIWVNVCNLVNLQYLKLAKKYGIKKRIIHSHSSENQESKWRYYLHNFNKRRVKTLATDYWACSQSAAAWFYNEDTIRDSVIIYNAIDISKFEFNRQKRETIRNDLGIADECIIGTVGRLTKSKNHEYMMELCSRLEKGKYHFVIVGMGELTDSLIEKTKELGIADYFTFAGRQSDIQAWLSSFDVFLFPSFYEGLSFAGIEAQANGVPLVASMQAIPEEAIFNDNVYKLPLEDIDLWIEKINDISNSDSRVDLNTARYNLSQGGFDISKEVERMESLL